MNLDNEQMTLLNNILSLLKEIMGSTDAIVEPVGDLGEDVELALPANVEDLEDPKLRKEDDDEDVEKTLTETASDGATANDDAEERIEDPEPEASAENVNEVAKMLRLLTRPNTVKKSKKIDPTAKVLKDLVKATNSIVEKQKTTDDALLNVLKGLGIADEIESANNIQAAKVEKGLNNTADVNKTLEYLIEAIKGSQTQKKDTLQGDNISEVRKSLSNVNLLTALVAPKK